MRRAVPGVEDKHLDHHPHAQRALQGEHHQRPTQAAAPAQIEPDDAQQQHHQPEKARLSLREQNQRIRLGDRDQRKPEPADAGGRRTPLTRVLLRAQLTHPDTALRDHQVKEFGGHNDEGEPKDE